MFKHSDLDIFMKSRKTPYQQIAVNPRMIIPRKSKGIVEISENTKVSAKLLKYPTKYPDMQES